MSVVLTKNTREGFEMDWARELTLGPVDLSLQGSWLAIERWLESDKYLVHKISLKIVFLSYLGLVDREWGRRKQFSERSLERWLLIGQNSAWVIITYFESNSRAKMTHANNLRPRGVEKWP